MSIEPDDDREFDDPDDCYRCNGEGFVWDCFDGFCVNAEDGCDDCTRACPECARRKRENPQPPLGQTLGDVLAEALNESQAEHVLKAAHDGLGSVQENN